MNIWSYWEGEKPEYIDVCIKSMARVCGDDFTLVTPETIADYVPDGVLHENWKTLPQPALRADCIRAALLAQYGGWWWDADTIAFRHPQRLRVHAPCLYMTWTQQPRRILNGYIYMEPGHSGASRWLGRVNVELAKGEADWCSLGEKLLTADLSDAADAAEIPRRLFLPVDIDKEVRLFFEDCNLGVNLNVLQTDTICFGLNHSWFMYHKEQEMRMPQSEWGFSSLLIHQLLDLAATLNEREGYA